MKIIAISDTHGLHRNLILPHGDMLIHAGDFTYFGTVEEVEDFVDWFSKQPFKYKIFIAGNHDLCLDTSKFSNVLKLGKYATADSKLFYLCNSFVVIEGIKIWGSPVTPYFLGMAFNKHRGVEIKKAWNKIPIDTDIIITHGPPFGILDTGVGCEELLAKVTKVKPKLHIFGHVHSSYGIYEVNGTKFVNAAVTDSPDFWRVWNIRLCRMLF